VNDKSKKPPATVFISYSRNDSITAKDLANKCKHYSLKTWLDEEQLRPGDNWQERMEKAIKTCNVAIIIISNDTLRSNHVNKEWSLICEEKWNRPDIKIIVLKLDDAKIPPFLCNNYTYSTNKYDLKQLDNQFFKILNSDDVKKENNKEEIDDEIIRLENRIRDLKERLEQSSQERGGSDDN